MLFKDNYSWVTLKMEDKPIFKRKHGVRKTEEMKEIAMTCNYTYRITIICT